MNVTLMITVQRVDADTWAGNFADATVVDELIEEIGKLRLVLAGARKGEMNGVHPA